MCGLIYSESFTGKPVNGFIFDQYVDQRYRGTEGFGVYDGQEMNMMHATKEDKLVKWLAKYDSTLLLMHHRYPTSTVNVKRAAHPFSTKKYFGDTEYILAHNGVMRNHLELFEKHQELGIEYYSFLDDNTFNDSESLLWDLALTLEGKQDAPQSIGRIAFIMLKKEKGKLTKLYFGRNSGSPLTILLDEEGMQLSSEGEGTSVQVNTLFEWDYAKKELTNKPLTLKEYEPVSYGSYPYYPYGGVYSGGSATTWDREKNWWQEELNEDKEVMAFEDRWRDSWDNSVNNPHYHSPRVQQDEVDELVESYLEQEGAKPTTNEVQSEAFSYLADARGVFEQAYWMVENDYDDLWDAPETLTTVKQRYLLERVMEFMMDDPEYIDDTSVSSMWSAICTA